MKNWYIRNNDEHLGPYSLEELKLVGLYSDDYVWKEGLSAWTKANAIEELKDFLISVEHPFFTPGSTVAIHPTRFPSVKKRRKGSFVNNILDSMKKLFLKQRGVY